MSVLAGARVLVTGGAGFIGSQLVRSILDHDESLTVRVLDNLSNGTRDNLAGLAGDRLTLLEGDMTDAAVVEESLVDVDVVFNLACLGVRHSLHDPVGNHRVNAEGTLLVLQEAHRRGVRRFVHVSSSEVFGTAQYAPMDERHPTWPETVYGASKLAGEAYARAHFRTYDMPVVVARPFNTYGPRSHFEGDSGEVIPRTIVRVMCGLPPLIFGDGKQTRDFTHVSDTASGLIALAECDAAVGETVNLGSGSEVAIDELAELVIEQLGAQVRAEHLEARPGDVRRLIVDPTLMGELTGWVPTVTFSDGIAELIEEFQRRPESPQEMLRRIQDRNWVAR